MAKRKGPGRAYRKGLTIVELLRMFPNDKASERWFENQRWPNGERFCPDCGSVDYTLISTRKPMPYRCRDCRSYFSVIKGSVMQSSKLGLQKWAIAIYLMTTGIKGTSSMRLHRELGIRQATAWYMMQRIREAFNIGRRKKLPGPIEVDETYVGGKERNKHWNKRLRVGGGTLGKAVVVGAKDRKTKKVRVAVIENPDKRTLQKFIKKVGKPEAKVYTDNWKAYRGLRGFRHKFVKHSAGEYVRNRVYTNGIESFWSLLKRGYYGTFHQLSQKHLDRYVQEFAGRNNIRDLDTVRQMSIISKRLVGKRLRYKDLVKD